MTLSFKSNSNLNALNPLFDSVLDYKSAGPLTYGKHFASFPSQKWVCPLLKGTEEMELLQGKLFSFLISVCKVNATLITYIFCIFFLV